MSKSNQSPSTRLVREVVALGKKCSKSDYPNPNREGCPKRSSLRAMAYRDRHLTLGDLPVSHIVGCSPCFQEYARFVRMSSLFRGLRVTAASLGVLAVVLLIVHFVWNYQSTIGGGKIPKEQLAQNRAPLAAKQLESQPVPFPFLVDLSSLSPTRGDASDAPGNKLHFPRKLLRVNFLLPLGMEPGEYTIRMQDVSGQFLAEQRALGYMKNGITSIQVEINLTRAQRGALTLMIRPPGSGWRRFPIVVN